MGRHCVPPAIFQLAAACLCIAHSGLVLGFVQAQCPPPGFDALQSFDVATYISKPWYVQKQMPLIYQPIDQLFCVRATYEPLDPADLFKGLRVLNYANRGAVNGAVVGTDGGVLPLTAVPNPQQPAKLSVGPDIPVIPGVNQLQSGAYWVVAVNTTPTGEYEWAIITGGPPTRATANGCMTGSPIDLVRRFQINDIGLWFFSRQPVDPQGTAAMTQAAQGLGLDTGELVDVQQAGCTYAPGAAASSMLLSVIG